MEKAENKIEVRQLKRSHIKALRAAELDPMTLGDAATLTKNAEMVEWILDNVYGDLDLENINYSDLVKLATDTYRRAYGGGEETKN